MTLTTLIGGVALIVIIAALVAYYVVCVPKTADKNAAAEFISGYKSAFERIIERIINEIDLTKFNSVEEFESEIYTIAYDECWSYTEIAIEEAFNNETIALLVTKAITRDNVETFIKDIIVDVFLKDIEAKWVKAWETTTEEIVEEDQKLQMEADEYEAEVKEVEAAPELANEEENVELNPQTDEEGPYEEDDNSQEIIEGTETEEVETSTEESDEYEAPTATIIDFSKTDEN